MTDPTTIDTITSLGGTGAVVAGFLWYLSKRDTLMQQTYQHLASKLEQLAHAISSLEERINSQERRRAHPRRGRPRKQA